MVGVGHFPGLEATSSQGGSCSLGSPQALHLHLAQPMSTPGKVRAPRKVGREPQAGTRAHLPAVWPHT